MRQITRKIVEAFESRRPLKIDNTRTDGTHLFLFDNMIAMWNIDGNLWITTAGWKTKTTKERLNGLTGVDIQTIRGRWYLNGQEWGGDWINVSLQTQGVLPEIMNDTPDEPEFDTTMTWEKQGYSKPIYSVFHTNAAGEIEGVEVTLHDAGIPSRRMESDTAGQYKPNYFIVVKPEDYDKALSTIKQ